MTGHYTHEWKKPQNATVTHTQLFFTCLHTHVTQLPSRLTITCHSSITHIIITVMVTTNGTLSHMVFTYTSATKVTVER